jgi:hypothetical protein
MIRAPTYGDTMHNNNSRFAAKLDEYRKTVADLQLVTQTSERHGNLPGVEERVVAPLFDRAAELFAETLQEPADDLVGVARKLDVVIEWLAEDDAELAMALRAIRDDVSRLIAR